MPSIRTLSLAAVGAALLLAPGASAQRSLDAWNLDEGLALRGYDPVAYFPEGGGVAAKGSAARSLTHEGVTYHFGSDANRSLFEKDPDRYEPAYGAWCAWAMAHDSLVDPDPEAYTILNDTLFVFVNDEKRDDWLKNVEDFLPRADQHWLDRSGFDESKRIGDLPPRDPSGYNREGGVSIEGYDPVAYFAEGGGKPTKGEKRRAFTFRGVTYRFDSQRNLERFKTNPDRYEPAYGAWCAWAMSQGSLAEVDPKSFEIRNGRLLLFYKGLFNNTREKWNDSDDQDALADRADRNWRDRSGEPPRINPVLRKRD